MRKDQFINYWPLIADHSSFLESLATSSLSTCKKNQENRSTLRSAS